MARAAHVRSDLHALCKASNSTRSRLRLQANRLLARDRRPAQPSARQNRSFGSAFLLILARIRVARRGQGRSEGAGGGRLSNCAEVTRIFWMWEPCRTLYVDVGEVACLKRRNPAQLLTLLAACSGLSLGKPPRRQSSGGGSRARFFESPKPVPAASSTFGSRLRTRF